MVLGAPFPDFLDWTWGELLEYIECRNEAQTEDLRNQASMLFSSIMLLSKVFNAKKGTQFKVVDAYPFLWSDAEREKMANDDLMRQLMKMTRQSDKDKYGYKDRGR